MRKSKISLGDLLASGVVPPNASLLWRRRQADESATILKDGRIRTRLGAYETPSAAARALYGDRPVDGWVVWRLSATGEQLASIRAALENRVAPCGRR